MARALDAELPDGRPWRVAELGAGWDHFTFRATHAAGGGDRVVRLPRRPESAAWLLREVEVLGGFAADLERSTGVLLPRYVVRGARHPALAHPFGVYPLLPGVPAIDAGLDAPAITRLGADVGRFLAVLHRVPLAVLPAEAHQAPHDDSPERLREQVDLVAPVLGARLARACAEWLSGHTPEERPPRVVTHADLGAEHLLVDASDGALRAVIDWGDVRVGAVSGDLAGGWVTFGDAFLDPALDAYAPPDREAVARLARFRGVRCLLAEVRWWTYRGKTAAARRFVDRLHATVGR